MRTTRKVPSRVGAVVWLDVAGEILGGFLNGGLGSSERYLDP